MSLTGSLSSGVSALKSFSKGLEVIGNNIANVNTTGFKASQISYSDTFSNELDTASSASSTNNNTSQVGTGVQVAAISTVNTQGSINETGVSTNLAIDGDGYFIVRNILGDENYATRAGDFALDDEGYLVNSSGLRLQGVVGGSISYDVTQDTEGNLIYTLDTAAATSPSTVGDMSFTYSLGVGSGLTVDSSVTATQAQIEANAPFTSAIAFSSDGTITVTMNDGTSFKLGQVLLMDFTNVNALKKTGDNLYTNLAAAAPTTGSVTLDPTLNLPGTSGLGVFKTRALELSNVDLTAEFANLIVTQRSFQAGSRIITVTDDILQEVVNLKR